MIYKLSGDSAEADTEILKEGLTLGDHGHFEFRYADARVSMENFSFMVSQAKGLERSTSFRRSEEHSRYRRTCSGSPSSRKRKPTASSP